QRKNKRACPTTTTTTTTSKANKERTKEAQDAEAYCGRVRHARNDQTRPLEAFKSEVKMSNLMKVLASEATQDPTKLEMEIRSAAAECKQAHVDRNIARKLTPAERCEKKEKKLYDDPNSVETFVCVQDQGLISPPNTGCPVISKFTGDFLSVNAQENQLTGCAVISDDISVVVVEGVRKSIKRYGKLMLRRVNLVAAVGNEEELGEETDGPSNSCVLVWQGSAARKSLLMLDFHITGIWLSTSGRNCSNSVTW
ncbi:protein RDM16-like, partial [Musa acuminata AAA Group]|uniref:protein RDM16-like n=1 Tax=Musa acuminata AAA Group TaxID=214697 RepID=UPI0031D55C3B